MIAVSDRHRWTLCAFGLAAALSSVTPGVARTVSHAAAHSQSSSSHTPGRSYARIILSGMVHRGSGSSLQCVPFARENSGIELAGNAANWWDAATGVYERGARPEVGSVLNFRASGRMRLGHVAVVSNVLDGRNVEIDHANWSGRGSIRRNVRVIDVSAFNDWSAVRVALGQGDFGGVYPTYGFIYDRPDHGTMVANTGIGAAVAVAQLGVPTALPIMAGARDLRAPEQRVQLVAMEEQEVAEAPEEGSNRYRYSRRITKHDGHSTRATRLHSVAMTVAHRTHTTSATTASKRHRHA